MTRLSDYLDHLTSVILSGAVGTGKTTIALAILHHARIGARFGRSRRFMRCDDLVNSSEYFLEHLSNAIGVRPTRSMEQLRPYLARLSPLMLVLDGVDCILDPLAVESKEAASIIEEISLHQNVCILATSRMAVNIQSFRTVEVTTPSGGGVRDVPHSPCHLDRSPAIDELLADLDFHPLSIYLLARATSENGWDESGLLREWADDKTDAIETGNRQSLEAAIKSVLASPAIRNLGFAAYETLEAISAFPGGVEEKRVERAFPRICGVAGVVDVLCKFYLVDRRGGIVRIPPPFRFHFMHRMSTMIHVREGEGNQNRHVAEEVEPVRCTLPEQVRLLITLPLRD